MASTARKTSRDNVPKLHMTRIGDNGIKTLEEKLLRILEENAELTSGQKEQAWAPKRRAQD